MRASFGRIREFLLNHTFLFSSNNGKFDGGGARRQAAAVDPILLHARPNLNTIGASRRRRRRQRRGGVGGNGNGKGDWMLEFAMMAHNATFLYPRKGTCHAFVTGPRRAAVLDVLFPLYDKGNGRECTYYKSRVSAEEEEDNGDDDHSNGGQDVPLLARAHQSAGRLQLPGWIIWSLWFGLKEQLYLDD
jgi:hypothetical protein